TPVERRQRHDRQHSHREPLDAREKQRDLAEPDEVMKVRVGEFPPITDEGVTVVYLRQPTRAEDAVTRPGPETFERTDAHRTQHGRPSHQLCEHASGGPAHAGVHLDRAPPAGPSDHCSHTAVWVDKWLKPHHATSTRELACP